MPRATEAACRPETGCRRLEGDSDRRLKNNSPRRGLLFLYRVRRETSSVAGVRTPVLRRSRGYPPSITSSRSETGVSPPISSRKQAEAACRFETLCREPEGDSDRALQKQLPGSATLIANAKTIVCGLCSSNSAYDARCRASLDSVQFPIMALFLPKT